VIDAINSFSDLELVLFILAVATGLVQLALLGSLVMRGGHVGVYWGLASVALFIALVLL
jgi:hypothetical protein